MGIVWTDCPVKPGNNWRISPLKPIFYLIWSLLGEGGQIGLAPLTQSLDQIMGKLAERNGVMKSIGSFSNLAFPS